VDRKLWDRVHAVLKESPRKRAGHTRAQTPALLKGIIYGADGRAMTPTHTRKRGKLYRYYVSANTLKNGADQTSPSRVPAGEIERAVIEQVRALLTAPEIFAATWRAARSLIPELEQADVRDALHRFNELWDELFPAEQARIVQLLVERIDINEGKAKISLHIE